MERWIILNKLSVILYIALICIQKETPNFSWVLFVLLVYFCLNISLYLIKNRSLIKFLLIISICLIVYSNLKIQPLFLLLLPMSILELVSYFTSKKWIGCFLALFPICYLSNSLQPIYGLISLFSFIVFSLVNLYNTRLRFKEDQIDKMRSTIQKLSKKINNHNEFIEQSEYTFKLEERNRISQEIHDKIGHSMTGALYQMEAAKHLMSTNQDKALELLQNAINISKDGIENIRLTLKNMKPPTEQMGIHHMKLFIDEFSAKHDLKTLFVYKGNLDLITPIQWKVIQENVVEALTNTMKYANATEVSLEIHVMNKMIKTNVKDNGKGKVKIKKGLGIIGMEERTVAINGKIIVDGHDGFSVTTLLPIQ
ncbi:MULTISPECIES: histidine kinase [Bacillaceae]|uniref:histidine kinase n=1 Tax=Gottfriedia luciferensis TaxID=178774 RepID=A0ABX2ZRD4_9BACI|nr:MULTISPECIES: histidine kinase [Bacillaceae]ODG92316.1 two-component sensor histidine kinase [Gottfriedia luciferensis]PGZ85369.1 histidine kinase [Bacillus sp. AFS029533]